MSLAGWWRSWWGDDVTAVISESEAIECARRHAQANHLGFGEPVHVQIEKRWIDERDPAKGRRVVYVLALGSNRPMPFVDVDGTNGAVLAWRTLSR